MKTLVFSWLLLFCAQPADASDTLLVSIEPNSLGDERFTFQVDCEKDVAKILFNVVVCAHDGAIDQVESALLIFDRTTSEDLRVPVQGYMRDGCLAYRFWISEPFLGFLRTSNWATLLIVISGGESPDSTNPLYEVQLNDFARVAGFIN